MHRRAKGLKKLGELARTRQVCSTTLRQMLQPMVWHIVIEPMEKDRMKREDGAYNISDEVKLKTNSNTRPFVCSSPLHDGQPIQRFKQVENAAHALLQHVSV
jgi:hypothetical protein